MLILSKMASLGSGFISGIKWNPGASRKNQGLTSFGDSVKIQGGRNCRRIFRMWRVSQMCELRLSKPAEVDR
jgi:hypothetical protein